MTHDLNASDFGDTLTGYDEIAIAQRFGRTITEMTLGSDFMMSTRALIFVAKRREDGATDDDAWTASMELPMKGVREFFADVPVDAEEDAGKDDAPDPSPEPEPLHVSSLSSVSSPDALKPSISA